LQPLPLCILFNLKGSAQLPKVIAFLLLLLFTISSVPKMYFHAAMVHHRDMGSCNYPDKAVAHIHTDGYNCDVDQQAITIPFVADIEVIEVFPASSVHCPFPEQATPGLKTGTVISDGRGPPYT